jgi:hypothetical protein
VGKGPIGICYVNLCLSNQLMVWQTANRRAGALTLGSTPCGRTFRGRSLSQKRWGNFAPNSLRRWDCGPVSSGCRASVERIGFQSIEQMSASPQSTDILRIERSCDRRCTSEWENVKISGGKRTRGIPRSNDRLVCKAGSFLKYWSVSCSLVRGRDSTVAIRSCAAAVDNRPKGSRLSTRSLRHDKSMAAITSCGPSSSRKYAPATYNSRTCAGFKLVRSISSSLYGSRKGSTIKAATLGR